MSFLEFFEALIGCAEKYVTEDVVKDPSTPRPSTSITKDESMYSMPGSPSRLTSHVSTYYSENLHSCKGENYGFYIFPSSLHGAKMDSRGLVLTVWMADYFFASL